MEPTKTAKPKYEIVKDRLETAIRSGEFKPGEQIPGERELSVRYNVSYMTIRRAISDLVSDNLLERRPPRGTFVHACFNDKIDRSVRKTVLNLIVSSYEGTLQRELLSLGVRLANNEGWYPNVVRVSEGQNEPAIRALSHGYSLVMLEEVSANSSLGVAVRKAAGNVVIIGQFMSSWGIPSVHYDVRQAVRLAIDRLRQAGHVDIGFVVQCPADPNNELKVDIWKEVMADSLSHAELEERLICVNTMRYQSPLEDAVQSVARFYGGGVTRRTTAFLCGGEELALGVVAGCRLSGHPVPEAVSLINIGDSSALTAYSTPPVTCIDGNLERQLEKAIQILKDRPTEWPEELLRHIVEPRMVDRMSVAPRQ